MKDIKMIKYIKNIMNKIRKRFKHLKIEVILDKTKYNFKKGKIKTGVQNFKEIIKGNKKVYIIAFIVFAIVISAFTATVLRNTKSADTIGKKYVFESNTAEDYYYNSQYDLAIEEYKKLQEKDLKEGLWDAKIGEIYSVEGDKENSKKFIDKAKALGSKNAEVLNYVVFTELMNKDYKEALQHGEEALGQFPKDKSLIKTMFTVYMANNMLDKAKALVDNYPVDEKSACDLAEYARMLIADGNWEEGYKRLRRAWDIDKDEYRIYDVLAQSSIYNKDKLLEDITALSEKNPDDLAYKMWLAKIYSTDEVTAEQGSKLVEELKTKDVGSIEVKVIEAAVLQSLKQSEKADELIKKVIEENKEDYRVFHTAGWYYLNKKDLNTAMQYCRESIKKNKEYSDNYGFLMPEILKALGKTKEGDPYFRTAIYKEPYNYNIMLTAANYYWNTTKDSVKALEYFNFAEIIKPDEPEIKYNMALINISNNNTEDAIRLLKECIKLSDDIAKYHRTLGTIYLLNGNAAEAIKEIRYAYGSDESDILTLNNAGCYYITQDVNFVKGEYNLRKALEGINASTDKYTSDTIKENYRKAKELIDKYNNGNGNQIKMPEFILFY
ncbi:tetratricopeptide repeat protein [Clostridium sp. SYSU_GA19001]|uniref:tetratricopeptide repeat protein n=1 Tax=Clostridium caldaquaticum TaxID=2940653 RepID=UPI0020770948|nr:tetratricopeptide repeat protein [Clostridium caldaquaticum]MCM8711172.1 tetratricopeptide repeat protein [Clostridium caldaquaticum]